MIALRSVSRTFGAVRALQDVTLDVAAGEFVAVIGRSGCGKSTLLRLIAGLLPPTAGDVRVDGERVRGTRADVSVVFQRPALLPWRSVLGNVLLAPEMAGRSSRPRRAAHREAARRLLESVGLAGFERRLPHELSGGMQQRVALCRALIREPAILLADEPFSALDALTREELAMLLQHSHLARPVTTVLVTHSIDEAVLLADRVLVLTPRPGRVQRVVEVDLPRPRTLGRSRHADRSAQLRAELHELLMPERVG